jgi:hypothetical protein
MKMYDQHCYSSLPCNEQVNHRRSMVADEKDYNDEFHPKTFEYLEHSF